MRAIVALSGGMDSATVLAEALSQERQCDAVSFYYASKHNAFENEKARELARCYGVSFRIINIARIMDDFSSNLLMNGGEIPEGHYEEESMKATIVPCRNMIFASILAGLAESIGAKEVWLGIHAGDHAIYPDCRPEFFYAMADAVLRATDEKVTLMAPFLYGTKTDILRRGMILKVPYTLTRTCYKNQEIACGKCGSCQERLEAFKNIGRNDVIQYEGA